MQTHTAVLYGCAAAVVVPGKETLTALLADRKGDSPLDILRAAWRRPVPMASVAVLALTVLTTAAQFAFPTVLEHLERDGAAFDDGQWWRLLTAVLVQSSGWIQAAFNFAALTVVGPIAERVIGPGRWLAAYMLSGLAENGVSAAGWSPHGAGSSVAICGLVGAMAALHLLRGDRWSFRRGFALLIPIAGVALCAVSNNHGVGLLTGCALGAVAAALPVGRLGVRIASAPGA
ncbi:rhomboid family intramembrane serine protease [Streptantibioticus ferralitis]|uniref:Rhomboid family intramembrane serine protease n=1 Tax=Streptantibioticus ferralitis TaxID=236510 RepID=A0ABT5Z9T5_9ACTN|nr:rhomboid family intramembrane serine protease [Streptantibioticus ferralitis]MDF2260606.1 rhomboid family intramembrane serine protease [Streptantibioticus ferralitis]